MPELAAANRISSTPGSMTELNAYGVGSEGRAGPGGVTPTGTLHAASLTAADSLAPCGDQRTLTLTQPTIPHRR